MTLINRKNYDLKAGSVSLVCLALEILVYRGFQLLA